MQEKNFILLFLQKNCPSPKNSFAIRFFSFSRCLQGQKFIDKTPPVG